MLRMGYSPSKGRIMPHKMSPRQNWYAKKFEFLLVTWHQPWSFNVLSHCEFFLNPKGPYICIRMLHFRQIRRTTLKQTLVHMKQNNKLGAFPVNRLRSPGEEWNFFLFHFHLKNLQWTEAVFGNYLVMTQIYVRNLQISNTHE